MKRSDPSGPPAGLSAASKKHWAAITREWELEEPQRLVLAQALRALDRLVEAQTILDKDGLMLKDRFGQSKAHPLLTVERDARSGLLRALAELKLDYEPINHTVGRPPGR